MIARLAGLLRRPRRRVAPALEDRLTALELALGTKMEAQLVVLAQALAEVATRELVRERRQLRLELALARDGAGHGVGNGAGTAQGLMRAAGRTSDVRAPRGSLLERAGDGPKGARTWGARP
jgi:hypothetical protein